MPPPLPRIIEQLKREPSRTGSIVITVFGDAIVPRGGSVWLGTLLEFFQYLDIDNGVVRTARPMVAASRSIRTALPTCDPCGASGGIRHVVRRTLIFGGRSPNRSGSALLRSNGT